MKVLQLVFLLFVFACVVPAQQTNIRVGATASVTTKLGLTDPTYGVTFGADYRKGDNVLSAEVDYFRLCKRVGGCGGESVVRGSFSRYLNPHVAIQGGIQHSYYKVELYDKSSVQVLGGVRLAAKSSVTEFNYRRDLTSNNKINAFETRATFYLERHIFIRFGGEVVWYQSNGKNYTGYTAGTQAGFYF